MTQRYRFTQYDQQTNTNGWGWVLLGVVVLLLVYGACR